MSDKVTVDLTGPAKTMLSTLYLKALDADFDQPVLGDRFAREAVGRIDYDWQSLGMNSAWAPLFTVRTAQYDIWAKEFLTAHPDATVVHVGCGMDSRVFRLDPGPGVAWFDVDFPGVIALREQVYPTRDGYRLIASSATDMSWLEQIPADRPTLFLAEGISMYLTAEEGVALLTAVTERFPGGEVQIDFFNWLAIRSQKTQTLVRRSDSTLHWAVNGPRDILGPVPALRLRDAVTFFGASTYRRATGPLRRLGPVTRLVPPLRNSLQYHRYAFGPTD